MMYQFNGRKIYLGNKSVISFFKYKFVNFPLKYHVSMAQRISSSQRCLRSQDRSYPVLVFSFFSCNISPKNSGSVKNRWCKACIYPALIRDIFSRRGPLSSGVIMCMYGNFTVRLVTVHTIQKSHVFLTIF